MGLICFDMITLKSRGETFGMPVRQCGDNALIALFCGRGSRRPLRQCIPQVICCHYSLSHVRDGSVGPATEAQQNGFDDRLWSNGFDTTCFGGTHGDTKIAEHERRNSGNWDCRLPRQAGRYDRRNRHVRRKRLRTASCSTGPDC